MNLQGIVQQIKDAITTAPRVHPAGTTDDDLDRLNMGDDDSERPNAAGDDPNRLIEAFEQETRQADPYSLRPKDHPAGRAVLGASPETQVAVLIALCARLTGDTNWRVIQRLDKLSSVLFARSLPFTTGNVERLLSVTQPEEDTGLYMVFSRWGGVTRVVRRYVDSGGELTATMRAALAQMRPRLTAYRTAEFRKTAATISELLGDSDAGLPDPGEAWAEAARADVAGMAAEARSAWTALFSHAATAETGKPSAKWLAEAAKNKQAVGADALIERVTVWMRLTTPPAPLEAIPPKSPHADQMRGDRRVYDEYQQAQREYYAQVQAYLGRISEKNIAMLKGLAWYAADVADAGLARALGHMAEAGFASVRERGAWAKTAGNAAIWALGQMPGGVGVGPLARLRTRLRDRSALKLIASAIETAAKNAGMTVDELEDLAVPTGGLDADGVRRVTFGEDGSATLTLDAKTAKTTIVWLGADGKPRKAVPAAVKKNFLAEVKALRAAEAEVKQALGAQTARFDRFLMDDRVWPLAVWRERYLSHPVLGNLARRLIWTFDGVPALPDDTPAGLPDGTPVRLWHPLGSPPLDVLRWRDTLEERGLVQPFKQAHREVYLLTDAERATRTYSNRFAAHILKQHQFNSLCVLRGWKNQLRLMVDDSYPPATRDLPRFGLRAEFWVEGIGEDYGTDTNETGTYLRVATDQVRFYRTDAPTNYAHASGGGYSANWRTPPAEALPLEDVPPLAFSEVMRDIDLFVGVASLGNDPTWADGGPEGRYRTYWQNYAFGDLGESAKTRAAVLARLLPRLKIASRSHLDGRFLVVRGDLRTYKIHLGSGNILMEPNDQYLCIVPTSRSEDTGDLFLPFEGDRTLAVILSKAFLLADDTHISDPTITRQIAIK